MEEVDTIVASQDADRKDDAGVGFRYSPSGQYHVGLYYPSIDGDGTVQLCHFAWDCDLRAEPIRDEYHRFPFVGLEPSELKVLAGIVGMVASKNASIYDPDTKKLIRASAKIRYGFVAPDQGIFDENSVFQPLPLGEGLTCATFVHRVLLYGGFETIDLTSLDQRAEDERWQKTIATALESADPRHAKAVRESLPARRLRPELIAAVAGCAADWELKYSEEIEKLAKEVVDQAKRASRYPDPTEQQVSTMTADSGLESSNQAAAKRDTAAQQTDGATNPSSKGK
jgi:hypothetical protein